MAFGVQEDGVAFGVHVGVVEGAYVSWLPAAYDTPHHRGAVVVVASSCDGDVLLYVSQQELPAVISSTLPDVVALSYTAVDEFYALNLDHP